MINRVSAASNARLRPAQRSGCAGELTGHIWVHRRAGQRSRARRGESDPGGAGIGARRGHRAQRDDQGQQEGGDAEEDQDAGRWPRSARRMLSHGRSPARWVACSSGCWFLFPIGQGRWPGLAWARTGAQSMFLERPAARVRTKGGSA